MKKIVSLLLVLAMVLSVIGCGTTAPAATEEKTETTDASAVIEQEKAQTGDVVAKEGGDMVIGMSTDASQAAAWRMRR